MDPGRRQSRRGIVWFALCGLLLFPALTGCPARHLLPPRVEHPVNLERLHFLTLGSDNYEDASRPESLAFVSDKTLAIGTEEDGVYFADLSDPAKPAVISVIEYAGYGAVPIVAMDGYVYGFTSNGALLSIDARQPIDPTLVDVELVQRGDVVLSAADDYLYVRSRGAIQIWDVSDPTALSPVSAYYPPQTRARGHPLDKRVGSPLTSRQLEAEKAHGTFMAHEDFPPEALPCERKYIRNAEIGGADVKDGLLYLWVSDAVCEGPEEQAYGHVTVSEGGEMSGPTPLTWPLITATELGGLWIIDVRNPAEPLAVSFLSADQSGGHYSDIKVIALAPDKVILILGLSLGWGANMPIVDVSDPTRPVPVGRPIEALQAAWEDNKLYVSQYHDHGYDFSDSLQVYNVANVAHPTRIGMTVTSKEVDGGFGRIEDITVRDRYIYLAERQYPSGGIHVLRLIDPDWRPDITPTGAPNH